jgi:hypothetical protein
VLVSSFLVFSLLHRKNGRPVPICEKFKIIYVDYTRKIGVLHLTIRVDPGKKYAWLAEWSAGRLCGMYD